MRGKGALPPVFHVQTRDLLEIVQIAGQKRLRGKVMERKTSFKIPLHLWQNSV
jgi:hypothetical protein